MNKSSVERGFAHGRLIKTEMIDLTKERGNKQVFEAEPQSVSGADSRSSAAEPQQAHRVGRARAWLRSCDNSTHLLK